jgi:hypothetical protein
MWFLFGAIVWTLWLTRNDCVFNNLVISSLRAVIYRLLSFLQHWMVVVLAEERLSWKSWLR